MAVISFFPNIKVHLHTTVLYVRLQQNILCNNKRHVRCCLTCSVLVTVLDELAKCYTAQEMFTEAESLYQVELSLLNERPEDNKRDIGIGQTCG